jgi:hypothetical protein
VETGELGLCSAALPDDMINLNIKLFLLGATLLFFLLLRIQGDELRQSYAEQGIVSLEFAYSAEKTSTVLAGWKADGLVPTANINILIDFLFIPFYAMLFYTLTGSISVRLTGKASTLGVLLAFFSLIAGLCDVIENIFMLISIHGFYNDLTTMVTAGFAGIKFLLLALALLYIIVLGLGVIMRRKLSPASNVS